MLCPNSASGRSSRWRSASRIWSARSGMLSTAGSWRRSWRPGYWTARTSTAGASALATGKKKLADPPACGRHTRRARAAGAGSNRRTHFSTCSDWSGTARFPFRSHPRRRTDRGRRAQREVLVRVNPGRRIHGTSSRGTARDRFGNRVNSPLQRHLRLLVGEVLTEAAVDALAEPEVALAADGQPVDPQRVGVGEPARVGVRGQRAAATTGAPAGSSRRPARCPRTGTAAARTGSGPGAAARAPPAATATGPPSAA